MTGFHASYEAAYGSAIAGAAASLREAGAPDDVAYRTAEGIMAELVRDGWTWRRREAPQPRRDQIKPAPPDFLADAREQLRLDLEAKTAAHRAREKQPTA